MLTGRAWMEVHKTHGTRSRTEQDAAGQEARHGGGESRHNGRNKTKVKKRRKSGTEETTLKRTARGVLGAAARAAWSTAKPKSRSAFSFLFGRRQPHLGVVFLSSSLN